MPSSTSVRCSFFLSLLAMAACSLKLGGACMAGKARRGNNRVLSQSPQTKQAIKLHIWGAVHGLKCFLDIGCKVSEQNTTRELSRSVMSPRCFGWFPLNVSLAGPWHCILHRSGSPCCAPSVPGHTPGRQHQNRERIQPVYTGCQIQTPN